MIEITPEKERLLDELRELEERYNRGIITKTVYDFQRRRIEGKLDTVDVANRVMKLQGKEDNETPLRETVGVHLREKIGEGSEKPLENPLREEEEKPSREPVEEPLNEQIEEPSREPVEEPLNEQLERQLKVEKKIKEQNEKQELFKKYLTPSALKNEKIRYEFDKGKKTNTNSGKPRGTVFLTVFLVFAFLIGTGAGIYILRAPSDGSNLPLFVNESAFPPVLDTGLNATNSTNTTKIVKKPVQNKTVTKNTTIVKKPKTNNSNGGNGSPTQNAGYYEWYWD